MNALLDTLATAGITLTVTGDRLRYAAPPGALTPALREQVAANKPALLALLAAGPESRQDAPHGPVAAGDRPQPAAAGVGHLEAMLPAGALPLWLFDRLHPLAGIEPLPAPAGMTEAEIAAATAEALAAYKGEVQRWRDHPPAMQARAPWRPEASCRRCERFDWYVDDAGRWRCGGCTPRSEGTAE